MNTLDYSNCGNARAVYTVSAAPASIPPGGPVTVWQIRIGV
jgi:hypothetical protein